MKYIHIIFLTTFSFLFSYTLSGIVVDENNNPTFDESVCCIEDFDTFDDLGSNFLESLIFFNDETEQFDVVETNS